MKYRCVGEVHRDFHASVLDGVNYLMDWFGEESARRVLVRTAKGVYRTMHEGLQRGDKTGLLEVSRTEPVCEIWAHADRDLARRKYEELVAVRGGTDLVKTNLGVIPPFIANRIADSARLEFLNPHFGTAFGFLRETDLATLPLGKVEIDGDNVFAFVSSPELKPFAERDCEVHRKYIDIHTPIVGEETFGSFTMTERELALPFNEKDDYALFKAKAEPITIRKGEFVAYFPPNGAHAPATYLGAESPKEFKKICVKVKS